MNSKIEAYPEPTKQRNNKKNQDVFFLRSYALTITYSWSASEEFEGVFRVIEAGEMYPDHGAVLAGLDASLEFDEASEALA